MGIGEVTVGLGSGSLLSGVAKGRFGSRVATWGEWWPMAGQTLVERFSMLGVFTLVLAASVQVVRRLLDKREARPA
mgnify:CR=1 FL=1